MNVVVMGWGEKEFVYIIIYVREYLASIRTVTTSFTDGSLVRCPQLETVNNHCEFEVGSNFISNTI